VRKVWRMTEFVTLDGGRIAYDVIGDGPLVVLSHGMGTWRHDYRHLVPFLADAPRSIPPSEPQKDGARGPWRKMWIPDSPSR
jgi:pimeloyl-ACP methyl ester carboxylesterase